MNELNEYPDPDTDQADFAWPELPTPTSAPTPGSASDTGMGAVLGGLSNLRELPVSEHHAVYSNVHDALLEFLNEDVPAGSGDA